MYSEFIKPRGFQEKVIQGVSNGAFVLLAIVIAGVVL